MDVAASPAAQQTGESIVTPQQIELVQSRFRKVVPIAGTAADLFYDRLFEIASTVRPMLPEDLAEQKKKLIGMRAAAVNNLDKLDTIVPAVQDLGRRHKGYGVIDDHYTPVGAALLWTLEQGLGADFAPDVKSAWTEAYTALAGVMKAA